MAMLGHVFKKIDKNNFQQDLINFFEFDNDISGSNGIEYTSKEALDAGYKSTAEFIVKQVIDSHGLINFYIFYNLSLLPNFI